jgi:hypothetical protein
VGFQVPWSSNTQKYQARVLQKDSGNRAQSFKELWMPKEISELVVVFTIQVALGFREKLGQYPDFLLYINRRHFLPSHKFWMKLKYVNGFVFVGIRPP